MKLWVKCGVKSGCGVGDCGFVIVCGYIVDRFIGRGGAGGVGSMKRKRGLKAVEKRLVEEYIDCRSFAEAYRRVMPDAEGMPAIDVARKASRAFTAEMREEIEEFDRMEEEARERAAVYHARKALAAWSPLDSVQTMIENIDRMKSQMDALEGCADDGDKRAIYDKMSDLGEEVRKTVEALNKMLGYNAPERVEAKNENDGRITVSWAEAPRGDGAGTDGAQSADGATAPKGGDGDYDAVDFKEFTV